ncbi:phosphatase PAP2 family protein [Bacillaceae bacterium W0354]
MLNGNTNQTGDDEMFRDKRFTLITLISLMIIFLFIFLWIGQSTNSNLLIDQIGEKVAHILQSRQMDSVMTLITHLGSVTFITISSVFLLILLILLNKHRIVRAICFLFAIIGIALLTKGLKVLYQRERPNIFLEYDAFGYSFPSGHSTGTIVFYGFIIYLTVKSQLNNVLKWSINLLLTALIIMIGFSRVYLEVHYLSDVVGGFLIGAMWLGICLIILEFIISRK